MEFTKETTSILYLECEGIAVTHHHTVARWYKKTLITPPCCSYDRRGNMSTTQHFLKCISAVQYGRM